MQLIRMTAAATAAACLHPSSCGLLPAKVNEASLPAKVNEEEDTAVLVSRAIAQRCLDYSLRALAHIPGCVVEVPTGRNSPWYQAVLPNAAAPPLVNGLQKPINQASLT